jgi:alpha-amylase
VVAVFPISQRLRYLIPFGPAAESLAYLAARRGAVGAVTVMDDGEKFGAWPGTHAHVYGEGWLDDFFDRVLAAPWLTMSTFSDVVDRLPPTGRVYLPTASYREMGEWVLPPPAARTLKTAKQTIGGLPDGERLLPLLRGGFWRGFLVKYPEVADTYWKMLRLSGALHRERARRADDPRIEQARTALWRGQANDAYWHGIFGGCYLPHLRRAIKSSLFQAERLLADAAEEPPVSWWRGDGNGDGREEIMVRTRELAVTVNPALGGSVTELGFFPRALDLADVLARRPEAYHDQLQSSGQSALAKTISSTPVPLDEALARLLRYDDLRRASLLDGLLAPAGAVDPVAPWQDAPAALGATRLGSEVAGTADGVSIRMAPEADPGAVHVVKQIEVRGAVVEAAYRLRAARDGRWAVQWNLALTAGDAPGRYLRWPDAGENGARPSLGSAGERRRASGVALVDEWIGVEARLTWSPAADVSWGPVETVSVSEAGFERIYQGTALLLLWPLAAGQEAEVRVTLEVTAR